jgi:hypothetical protein
MRTYVHAGDDDQADPAEVFGTPTAPAEAADAAADAAVEVAFGALGGAGS